MKPIYHGDIEDEGHRQWCRERNLAQVCVEDQDDQLCAVHYNNETTTEEFLTDAQMDSMFKLFHAHDEYEWNLVSGSIFDIPKRDAEIVAILIYQTLNGRLCDAPNLPPLPIEEGGAE